MLPTPSLLDPAITTWLLNDADGSTRAAVICWAVALSAFIILRIPRAVLLGCLILAGATVGLAAAVVDMASKPAIAGAREVVSVRGQSATPMRGPAVRPIARERPY